MKLPLAAIAALASFAALCAESEFSPVRPHPRLFANDAEFAAAKSRLDASPEGSRALASALADARAIVPKPVLTRKMTGRRLLGVSREALRRIGHLAFAWRATGDRAFADRAIAEARAVCAFSDWNPSHFLDVGEMTLAVAIARDWLDGVLADDDKRLFDEAILLKGLTKGDGKTLQDGWWVRGDNNWNQVCHGGLSAGAAAVRDAYPEVAEAVLRRARNCLPIAMKAFAGGNFPEGPGYWEYATDFTAIALDVLERQFADGVPELFATDGLAAQADYLNHVTGPFGLYFNYSDPFRSPAVARRPVAACWYLASRFGRADSLLQSEWRFLRQNARWHGCGRMTPFLLLWFRQIEGGEAAFRPCTVLGGKNPIAILRSGAGEDSWYVGIKGGLPSASHGHMDCGSFVLDAGGARWAFDLGCEEYNRIEQMNTIKLWGRQQNSSRWSLFRLNTDGHGTLSIDGAQQNVNGLAKISGKESATVDLSSVYPAANSVKRTFSLAKGGLRIEDSLAGLRPGAVVTWNMNTAAKARSKGNVLFLETTGAGKQPRRMTLTAEPVDVAWEISSIAEPRIPADSPNPGMTRVSFSKAADESGKLEFTVAFALMPEHDYACIDGGWLAR